MHTHIFSSWRDFLCCGFFFPGRHRMLSGGNSTDKNKGTPMKRAKWHLGNYFYYQLYYRSLCSFFLLKT